MSVKLREKSQKRSSVWTQVSRASTLVLFLMLAACNQEGFQFNRLAEADADDAVFEEYELPDGSFGETEENEDATDSEEIAEVTNPGLEEPTPTPPTTEEPPIVTTPPTTEEPPIVTTPPTTEEPPIVTTPPTTEEPPVVTTPPTTEPPTTPPVDPPTTPPVDPPVVVTPPVEPPVVIIPPPVVELEAVNNVFTQNEEQKQKVDILWVIDNSGSMKNDQENLADNFDSFINAFISRAETPDFLMGFISTETAYYNGKLYQNRVLSREDLEEKPEKFARTFKRTVQMGIKGSGHEVPLASVIKAQEYDHNYKRFFREDAMLVINILSDENDNSVRRYKKSTEELVEKIKDLKGEGRVIINSIVAFEDGRDRNWQSRGEVQLGATDLTNGLAADIRGDFASTLSNFGEVVVELASSFPLGEKPYDASAIIVSINGQEVEGWSYDSELNVIKFNNPPAAGAEITINYQIEVK